jgi:hypothetical protein
MMIEMSIETYIRMEGKERIELKLTTVELVDAVLGINYAQEFYFYIDMHYSIRIYSLG